MLTWDFWLKDASFYLDHVSFVHKLHPMDEMRTYWSSAYQKKDKGLCITAKGKKEGVDGKTVHLFVAIAYGKGVVMCEQFLGKHNGDSYLKSVRKYFPAIFVNNNEGKWFLQVPITPVYQQGFLQ